MRKRILNANPPTPNPSAMHTDWLSLDQIASVEVSSEEVAHPIENALLPGAETGWRAARPGEQTIRLIFDTPQSLRHIRLVFVEHEVERSQEFSLRWSPNAGQTWREIVRQQWNFSLPGSTQETGEYQVELTGVTQLELKIVPDRSGGSAQASLAQFRIV